MCKYYFHGAMRLDEVDYTFVESQIYSGFVFGCFSHVHLHKTPLHEIPNVALSSHCLSGRLFGIYFAHNIL